MNDGKQSRLLSYRTMFSGDRKQYDIITRRHVLCVVAIVFQELGDYFELIAYLFQNQCHPSLPMVEE